MVKAQMSEMEEKREKQLLNEKEELRKRKSDKEALLNDLVNHPKTGVNLTLIVVQIPLRFVINVKLNYIS